MSGTANVHKEDKQTNTWYMENFWMVIKLTQDMMDMSLCARPAY